MSTKAIRELILLTRPWREEAARKALEEVETIERAAKVLAECAVEAIPPVSRSECSEAHDLMASIAKETLSGLAFSGDVPVEVTVLPRKQRKNDKEAP